jgi:hypothetical protein
MERPEAVTAALQDWLLGLSGLGHRGTSSPRACALG